MSGQAHAPSATEIAKLVVSGKISAQEATSDALARIAKVDDALCAFCTLSPEQALADAKVIDDRLCQGEQVGPLAGVPVAIKDLLSTRDLKTTFGSPLYANYVPKEDDIAVERLRSAGAVIIGKTNTSEFGYGAVSHNALFPATRNPWDLEKSPGGSSAGSAAAVAGGMVPIALGSDGGGSIRIPAALTGVFGLKPSWGRVPVFPGCRDERMPGASGWESLEHVGPITRTVADAALAMSVLSGPSSRDRHSVPFESIDWMDLSDSGIVGSHVAFTTDCGFARVDPEVAVIAERAARILARELGTSLEMDAPGLDDTQRVFEALVALDTDRVGLKSLARAQKYAFQGQLRALLEKHWSVDEFTAAILERKAIANTMWRFMEKYRFLLTPTVSVAAFDLNTDGPAQIAGDPVDSTAWTPLTALANLTGQPAASVPAGFTSNGHPVGLQIVGRHLDDRSVLCAAAIMERASLWHDRWPNLT